MKTIHCLTALLVITGTHCASMKMSVDENLQSSSDEYAVKGRQGILIKQKLQFGEFNTSTVKRSWTKGSSSNIGFGSGQPGTDHYTNIISVDHIRRKQTIFFSLTDGSANVSEVYCTSRFNARDINLGRTNNVVDIALDLMGKGGSSESNFYVQIYTGPGKTPWQMVIDNQAAQAAPRSYTGKLMLDQDHYYTLVPVTKMESKGKSGNTLLGSIGFEFRDKNDKAVGAVSLIDNGMIVLGKTTAEERFLLANACAALLLQEEIE